MKQKAIEQFLGISREDKYTGGQLIEVYRDYLHTHEKSLYDLLILHNEDDLKGMPAILPILSYADFFHPLFSLRLLNYGRVTVQSPRTRPFCILWVPALFLFPFRWNILPVR